MTQGDYFASLPRKLVGAGALITDEDGRLLLVEPTYKDAWEIPGGVVEAAESPRAGVQRELLEELGLPIPVGQLLVVDWNPPRPEAPDRPDGLMFVFDAGVLTPARAAEITLPATELRSWRWCTPAEAEALLPARLHRRMAAALQARSLNVTVYLENGHRPTS
ncbi:NUDIX domain-containing protein [Paractinoplanes maris]|uniref:NUDIX domain-containing protein n=1 Tax=Paractinoplanes maris TaxID=1734446 RepID=UPI002020FD50|nr:NUDIX hydrolase [Actinoplanes maris]